MPPFFLIKNKHQLTLLIINVSVFLLVVVIVVSFLVFLGRSLNKAINAPTVEDKPIPRFNLEKARELNLE